MEALVVTPGEAGSARVADVPAARPGPGEVVLRTLEIGVCGTDREIAEGLFGSAPEGDDELILGHELLGEVLEGAGPFRPGELVAATVRRSCGHCAPCAEGSVDACLTGDYRERGITALHGFASEVVTEASQHLVPIPPEVGRLGVLAEPSSVCARGIRHAETVGRRQPWQATQALVLGAGAIGVLTTCFLRLRGYEVSTASRGKAGSEKAELVEATGARYVSTSTQTLRDLASEIGGFDLVVEAAGDADVMAESLAVLRRNGVACLLGIDGRPGSVSLDRRTLAVDLIVQNRALLGSVNAHPEDWSVAVRLLGELKSRWPEIAERLVGRRVEPGRFEEAFAFRGVKATLQFA
jgi:threonine dehydrogenase-like Zn-dependent dehydrogenase